MAAKKRADGDRYDEHILAEAHKIVLALGKMFAPVCEVILHDLRKPEASIVAIENAFCGRKVGDSSTVIGLARITDPQFPDILQNYPNVTEDGRAVKSTSIGLRGRSGDYIASICLNMDVSHFNRFAEVLQRLVAVEAQGVAPREKLRTLTHREIHQAIEEFAARKNLVPRQLPLDERRKLMGLLEERGLLGLKNAISTVAASLGVSRPSVYNYLRASQAD
ncbi:MAG: transcriptional regulator [Reyranellaceae bacterium]